MRWLTWSASLFGVALLLTLATLPAQAQATRTWVSGVGDDANPCSRTAPCKTFAGAISKTAAGGEISVLDPGGYGAVTITKSISIINSDSGEAGILSSGTNGIVVNAAATDMVILRGLVIDGAPPGTPGLNGIRFIAGGSLHVENCLIKNYSSSSAGNGNGILFAPAGNAELYVVNSTFINNGKSGVGGAITIKPTAAAGVKASLNNVNAEDNDSGFSADGTATTGTTTLTVRDSVSSGAPKNGISALTLAAGGGTVSVILDRAGVFNNLTAISSVGAKSFVVLSNSTISGNTTGASASGSGQILTFQNNAFAGNNADGATTGNVAPK